MISRKKYQVGQAKYEELINQTPYDTTYRMIATRGTQYPEIGMSSHNRMEYTRFKFRSYGGNRYVSLDGSRERYNRTTEFSISLDRPQLEMLVGFLQEMIEKLETPPEYSEAQASQP